MTPVSDHVDWLAGETRRLLEFARGSLHPAGGFAFLDDRGVPQFDRPVETWLTARMTHVFAIGSLLGEPDCERYVEAGVGALRGRLHDGINGGWHSGVAVGGAPTQPRKEAYQHAFVVLAASSAQLAGIAAAEELLDEALAVVDRHFWDERAGALAESFAADWSDAEPYRGANSNMHAVEALLAAYDATGDDRWRERALSIASRVIDVGARGFDWRVAEHFDADWQPLPDYNADNKPDQFRPYGLTIGHWLEWSRLLLHLEAATPDAPVWLGEAAAALFANAVRVGWAVDGADGFVYTVDWEGTPVVRARMHWVLAEGIGAAAALHERFGTPVYAERYVQWWAYAQRYLLDLEFGSWHHELDAVNMPASTVWAGKPDVYHAFQATLLPRLPLAPTLTAAVARGMLGTVTPPAGEPAS
jgi:mannose/cellobiose epimerase-like protein (N-acyl-D-glucosamine 2-epimerase family)